MCLMGILAMISLNDLNSDPGSGSLGRSTITCSEGALALQEGPHLLGILASFLITYPSSCRRDRERLWSTIYTFLHYFRVRIFEKMPMFSRFESYDNPFVFYDSSNQ